MALHILANGYVPDSGRIERDEEVGAVILRKGAAGRGAITSADGKPVANATVAIHYGMYEHVTKTNAQGQYEAPDPKGATWLAVVHPDYADRGEAGIQPAHGARPHHYAHGRNQDHRSRGRSRRKDAGSGAALSIDSWPMGKSGEDGTFTIAHAPARWMTLTARSGAMMAQLPFATAGDYTLRLARAATVLRRVTDAKTKAGAGVIVRLTSPRANRDALAAETDAKGTYSIVAPQGSFLLYTFHPGYDPANADLSIEPGQQVARDLTVPRLARVSGTVLDEEKRPVVAAGVASEEVDSPMSDGPARMMRSRDTVVSGPDGRFSTRVAPDEPLQIVATKRGFPRATSERFRLAPGERKAGLVLTIPSGIAVSGRVTDGKGEPLSGVAVVTAESSGGDDSTMMFAGMQAGREDVVRTGADGSFTLRLEEGTYDFNFLREGYAPKTVRAQSVSRLAAPSVETTMELATEISGRVVRGGAGIAGVNVNVFTSGINAAAVTGADGSFTLSGLAPGSVRVMLWKADDFIQDTRSLTAPARDVTIEIPGGGRVTGRVVDKATGKPLTSFQAGVSTSRGGMMAGPPQMRELSSEDGSFTLEERAVRRGVAGSERARLRELAAQRHGRGRKNADWRRTVARCGRAPDRTRHRAGRNGARRRVRSRRAVAYASIPGVEPGIDLHHRRERRVLARSTRARRGNDRVHARGTCRRTEAGHAEGTGDEARREAHRRPAGDRRGGDGSRGAGAGGARLRVGSRDARRERGHHQCERRLRDGDPPSRTLPVQRAQERYRPGNRGRRRHHEQRAGAHHHSRGSDDSRPRHRPCSAGAGRGNRPRVRRHRHGDRKRRRDGELPARRSTDRHVTVRAEVDSHEVAWERTSQVQTIEVAPGGSQNVDLTFRTDIVIRGRVARDGRPHPGRASRSCRGGGRGRRRTRAPRRTNRACIR